MDVIGDLQQAREAYERREWVSAFRALSDLDDTTLQAADFSALATTAYLLGRYNDSIQAFQRAYRASLDAGDRPGAVRAACALTMTLRQTGELAVANGWHARATRILDELGGDIVERGYVCESEMMGHIANGDLAAAFPLAPLITDYGRRFDEPDLFAVGLHSEGRLLLYSGRVADGLQRMDEAMVGVMAGEVGPVAAGHVYCSTIEACQEVSDLRRAGEWTHALTTWCDAQPGLVAFTGQCATHRGQLLRLHGAYASALEELDGAVARYLDAGSDPALGLAHYERAEVYRVRGEYAAAESAYDAAAESGHSAQPGRALLWLAQGRVDAAAIVIRRLLGEVQDPVQRSQILAAAIEVLMGAGDVESSTRLSEELCLIGEAFGSTALQAAGLYAVASTELARGAGESAFRAAGRATQAWSQVDSPYESARSRVLVGRALRLLGDEASALADLAAARRSFADLGAVPAREQTTALMGEEPAPSGLTPRELEVLRLVASGRSNAQIAGELVLSEKTVARHLSSIFTKLDVHSRTAAAAYAYEQSLI